MRWRRTPSNAKTITVGDLTAPPDEHPTAAMQHAHGVTLPPTFCAGDVLAGRFRVVRFIAQGGMGEVYEAADLELGDAVALKTIHQGAGDGEQALERFRREVLLARKVTHPNVCRIFDVFRHRFAPGEVPAGGRRELAFLSMELLRGETLAERLRRRGRMSTDEALPVAEQMAAALDAAHQAGIVHRDFKSNNVMLIAQRDGAPRAVVTDFGLAGAHDEREQPQDEAGLTMGTPAYMAPEQVEADEVTPAADVYSFGVVLYEMVTATVPFMAMTAAATANLRLHSDPPSPRRHVPELDARWESVILRCLARRPAERFASAGAAAAALRPPEPAPRAPRSRVRLLGEVALVLALVALGAYAVLARRASESGPLEPLQITTSAGLDLFPAISPDGKRLAYASDRSGSFEIYVRDLAPGAADTVVTRDGAQNFHPRWSPDGRTLVYHSKDKGGLWLVPAEGGSPRRLTDFGSRPAWSPGGSRIAFQSEALVDLAANAVAAMPPSTLWVVPAEGGAPVQVTTAGSPPGGHGGPAWSPDETRLVFTASDRRASSVWSVGVDGGGLVRLATGPTYTYDPVFSRDGRSVYYSALSASGNYGMWRVGVDSAGRARGEPLSLADLSFGTSRHLSMARDGRRIAFSALRMSSNLWRVAAEPGARPRPLTAETGRNARPVFSPDGLRLAFDRWQSGTNPDVWVMDADGAHARQVVSDRAIDTVPNWTPDGRRLVFVSDRNGRSAVWTADAGGGGERLLLDLGSDTDWVRLSPDGRSLAFARRSADGIVNVWRAALPSGTPRQLTSDPEFAGFPCWSPDGRFLAVQLKRGEDAQVAVMPAEGGRPVPITTDPGQHWPYSWSPDGRHVAFAGLHEGFWNVYRVERASGREERLTRYEKLGAYVRYPAWSPRGDALVYEYAETTGNVWLLDGLR
jgi:Tol biopolymer transport system component